MNFVRGIGGAVIGGALGYLVFYLLYKQGFYMGILPGAALGMGAGYASGGKSILMGVICLFLGAILSVVGEWYAVPFAEDESLSFFIKNIMHKPTVKLLMLGAGTFAALWFGIGRERLFTHGRS